MSGRSLGLLLLALSIPYQSAHADDTAVPTQGPRVEPTDDAKAIASIERSLDVIDIVLEHHVEPPTRPEILQSIARVMLGRQFTQLDSLANECMDRRTSREFLNRIREEYAARSENRPNEFRTPQDVARANMRRTTFGELLETAALRTVRGHTFLVSANELKARKQMQANSYIGVGIFLNTEHDRSTFIMVSPRGPAAKAGIEVGDELEAVDGQSTAGVAYAELLDRIRGPVGTTVTLTVRKKGAAEACTKPLIRSVIPRDLVHGWDYTGGRHIFRLDPSSPIAYARIHEIGGSTVQELHTIEQQLAEGVRAIVLDLRDSPIGEPHFAVLVADALLDGGTIGRLRTRTRVREFVADRDCLFRGWPMVVLVNEPTSGTAEWLAAALQDNRRAVIVGEMTQGEAYAQGTVPLPGGNELLELATGILERPSGKSLVPPQAQIARRGPGATSRPWGVHPDAYIGIRPEFVRDESNVFIHRLSNGAEDPGVKKACEILQAELDAQDAQAKTAAVRVPKPSTARD